MSDPNENWQGGGPFDPNESFVGPSGLTGLDLYGPQPNAPVRVIVALHLKDRDDTDRFRPTYTTNESFKLNSTLSTVASQLTAFLTPIWNYTVTERAHYVDVSCHITVRIENVTAPHPPSGAWVQAKGNFDAALSDGDYSSLLVLQNTILGILENVQTLAKY